VYNFFAFKNLHALLKYQQTLKELFLVSL